MPTYTEMPLMKPHKLHQMEDNVNDKTSPFFTQ